MTTTAEAPPESDTPSTDKPEQTAEEIAAKLAEREERRVQSIERVAERGILASARTAFDAEQISAMKKTVAKDCTDAEFVMFLEVAARYQLDPFAKQIYAAKMKGGVQIIVSRDGLLALAHKREDFQGMMGDVVRRSDEFSVAYKDGKREVEHRYSWPPKGDDGGDDEIIGAWAEVRREGHEPTFFFAPLGEYKGENNTPWGKQTSAMILKVAESMALRKAYSVSGVVGEDEVSGEGKRGSLTDVPEPEWGDDDALAARLQMLFEQANDLVPGSYRPRKVETMLDGQTQERRKEIAEDLERFIAENTGEEQGPTGSAAEAEITDAEVVTDGSEKE